LTPNTQGGLVGTTTYDQNRHVMRRLVAIQMRPHAAYL
jgi:hypothetical protein